ncbi:hypothetical protein GCM10022377_28550 [Zhihengliuella alba]|uniref:Uncharacterized protein n=1 Tax=Zhihengliuella alba TaxID=547018 RepID=A0ABP7E3T6_9MICC
MLMAGARETPSSLAPSGVREEIRLRQGVILNTAHRPQTSVTGMPAQHNLNQQSCPQTREMIPTCLRKEAL